MRERAPHAPQRRSVSFSSEVKTFTRKLSQLAQAVVGSAEPGSEMASGLFPAKRPVRSVLISKVLRQSAQTWLNQHFGSQE